MGWLGRKEEPVRLVLPPVKLMGERVYVRPPTPSDWPAWSSVRRDNQKALETLEPTWPEGCLGQDFFMRRLKRQTYDWFDKAAYSFLVFHTSNRLIGGINLNHVAHGAAQNASLGYWLDEKHQGQGYMREALALVIKFAFTDLGLHRLHGACLPGNAKSVALLKGLGFAEEGFAKSYYRINGQWEDHVLFGLIKSESAPMPEQPE
jgi:ribosomal-protein-alanine N-acetyltransferase